MDGKTIRNAVAPGGLEGSEVTLFSAMLNSEAVVIAQLRVPEGTDDLFAAEFGSAQRSGRGPSEFNAMIAPLKSISAARGRIGACPWP
jgi:hypothetical protein